MSVTAEAVSIKQLDPARRWRVKEIVIKGNQFFPESTLLDELVTKPRAWFTPWRKPPLFDPVTFDTDLERIKRFYESRGYYEIEVTHDLQVQGKNLLVATITVTENRPVRVAEMNVEVSGIAPTPGEPTMPEQLPLKVGDIFTEEAYRQTEQVLSNFLLDRGHANVQTERKANIDVKRGEAFVTFKLMSGPKAVFGETRVEGAEKVDPQLILRELTYRSGERFSLKQIQASLDRILELDLFRSVQVLPAQTAIDATVIPMRVVVKEQPQRDIKFGIGYSTEDELRGQAEWSHLNWFGDGRRLSFALKLSTIHRVLHGSFIQPHFLTPDTRGVVQVAQEQQDEDTFLLNISRVQSRIEHQFSPALSGFVDYRAEYADLSDVAAATIAELGGVKEKGFLFGPSAGLVWNKTDDAFDPKQGGVVSVLAEQAGSIWGGDFNFFRFTVEGKKYRRVGWDMVLAGRLKIGVADALGEDEDFPIFERFYAGGERSVRGYGRRRLGPISASDDPLGGLSLVEGSVELRRPLGKELSGAVFIDFGQVSLAPYDLPFDDLKFAAGAGIAYTTPLGPLRLDIGFPFDPPRDDSAWQVHFSIGQFF